MVYEEYIDEPINATQAPRLFITLRSRIGAFPFPVTLKDEFTVNHLLRVLRLKMSDSVIAIDGEREIAYDAVIHEIGRGTVTLFLQGEQPQSIQGAFPHIILGLSMIRSHRWDWCIQKITELGVREVIPLSTERTVIKVSEPEKKRQRWQSVAQSAAEQSEGLFIPTIHQPVLLKRFIQQTSDIPNKFLLHERGEDRMPLRKILPALVGESSFCFAIGPEGGLTDLEAEMLIESGFQPVSLGERILRSETAAIAILSIMAYETDRLSDE